MAARRRDAYDRVSIGSDYGQGSGPTFAVDVRRAGVTVQLIAAGELDVASVHRLRAAIDGALREGCRQLILDLRELEFIDSTGLHVVVETDELARRDGFNFAVVRGSLAVHRLFELVGLAEHVVFVDDPEDLAPPAT